MNLLSLLMIILFNEFNLIIFFLFLFLNFFLIIIIQFELLRRIKRRRFLLLLLLRHKLQFFYVLNRLNQLQILEIITNETIKILIILIWRQLLAFLLLSLLIDFLLIFFHQLKKHCFEIINHFFRELPFFILMPFITTFWKYLSTPSSKPLHI